MTSRPAQRAAVAGALPGARPLAAGWPWPAGGPGWTVQATSPPAQMVVEELAQPGGREGHTVTRCWLGGRSRTLPLPGVLRVGRRPAPHPSQAEATPGDGLGLQGLLWVAGLPPGL